MLPRGGLECRDAHWTAEHHLCAVGARALVDGRLLLTGSYNWTYAAASSNCENALATDDGFFVQSYEREFARLWGAFHAKTRRASNVHEAALKIQSIERRCAAKRLTRRKTETLRQAQAAPPPTGTDSFPALGNGGAPATRKGAAKGAWGRA